MLLHRPQTAKKFNQTSQGNVQLQHTEKPKTSLTSHKIAEDRDGRTNFTRVHMDANQTDSIIQDNLAVFSIVSIIRFSYSKKRIWD
jgi:hypothetical protein